MDAGRREQRDRADDAPYLTGVELHNAAAAALIGMDWRALLGLPATHDPHDPLDQMLTFEVLERAWKLRERELEYIAVRSAQLIAG